MILLNYLAFLPTKLDCLNVSIIQSFQYIMILIENQQWHKSPWAFSYRVCVISIFYYYLGQVECHNAIITDMTSLLTFMEMTH